MSARFVVAGTDTDVGKTVFAAALAGTLAGAYWKPIQAGTEPQTDREFVRRLSGLGDDQILPEAYIFATPASPHRAAELEAIEIDLECLRVPAHDRQLVIEPAGGLLVPLTRKLLQIELIAEWGAPVILCSRTGLGTINHSLLSLEALRRRRIPVHGVAFIGEANDDTERTICEFAGVRRLGRLPMLDPLDRGTLRAAFAKGFHVEDFAP